MSFVNQIAAARVTLLSLTIAPAGWAQLPVVPTARVQVTNYYQGIPITEDNQWLEQSTNAAVRDWTRRQNERTRAYFEKLPFYDGLSQALEELITEESASYDLAYKRGETIFALRNKPPAQQPVLVRLKSVFPPALRKVVFDPNLWNTNGTTAMDWFVPSPDGRLVAVCLSENGSENGTLHFFETDTGRHLPDIIRSVQYPTGGGSAAWNANDTHIFYTRYPRPGERPEADLHFYQQIWLHKMGAPESADTFELGREFPRIAEIDLDASEDGRWLLATVANGDGGDFAHYLRNTSGHWRQLTHFEDGVKQIKFGHENALYLRTLKNAPRGKILRLSPIGADFTISQTGQMIVLGGKPDDPERLLMHALPVVVPEGRGVIENFEPSARGLYVDELNGGPSRLRFYRQGQRKSINVPILSVSSVGGLHCWHEDEVLFANTSYLALTAWYEWQPGLKSPRETALRTSSPASFDDIEVVREFSTSKDGTKVPLNIMRKRGLKLDGNHPTILYGYGGYGINLSPGFNAMRRVWFDAGGVYAIANLRGGGEFGEEWHKAGNLTKKQNVFDDFIACAEYLLQHKYTRPAKLAVSGSSNGGLLMGAFLTQRPELARAVVSRVGIYDMLRVELDPNGAFNITEFGSVTDSAQFQALYAYSPYHHVKNGTAYPAVLFPCGENDGRLNPAHSRKMTARLQAATASSYPILLRVTAGAGHGMGSALKDRVAEQTAIYAFLFEELGVDTSPWNFN